MSKVNTLKHPLGRRAALSGIFGGGSLNTCPLAGRGSLLITSPSNYTDSGRIKPSGSTFVNDFVQKIDFF